MSATSLSFIVSPSTTRLAPKRLKPTTPSPRPRSPFSSEQHNLAVVFEALAALPRSPSRLSFVLFTSLRRGLGRLAAECSFLGAGPLLYAIWLEDKAQLPSGATRPLQKVHARNISLAITVRLLTISARDLAAGIGPWSHPWSVPKCPTLPWARGASTEVIRRW